MKLAQTEITEIKQLHAEIEASLKTSLEKAVRVGKLLCRVKDKLKHGEFMPWIKDNLPFTDRTARNYINLFENRENILQAGSVTEAYKMLSESKTETISDLNHSKNVFTILNREIYLLKIISRLYEDHKEGDSYYILNFDCYDSLKVYTAKQREKVNNAKNRATLIQVNKEIQHIQKLLGEKECWQGRICGQLYNICRPDELKKLNGLLDKRTVTMNKKLAGYSFEMLESTINQFYNERLRNITML
ncbi:MAG: DUF3102 domain-containing protein [Prolixibacteraceae bacterium]|nr:DUF3102 domain-containing protein [Prolixibacteraceae bacterium]